MKLTLKDDTLQFTEISSADEAIVKKLEKYQLKVNGGLLEVRDADSNVLVVCDAVDNTVIIPSPQKDAFEVANLFGAKRFVLSDGNLSEAEGSQLFPRDRRFNLDVQFPPAAPKYQYLVGLEQIEAVIPRDRLYKDLAELFKNYADFTESKKLEYTQDEMADKHCRLNNARIVPIVLVNESKVITGCIRVLVVPTGKGSTAYLSDEVVRYDQPGDRQALMSELFEATRQVLKTIPNITSAFLRVAAGREQMYEELGCSKENTGIHVIHGQPTQLLKAVQALIKETAAYKLSLINTPHSSFIGAASSQRNANVTDDEETSSLKILSSHRP